MRDAGFHFDVRLKEIKEVWPSELDSRQVAEYLAILKATAFVGELADDELLITADTIVCLDDIYISNAAGNIVE
jgi:septum formation protein